MFTLVSKEILRTSVPLSSAKFLSLYPSTHTPVPPSPFGYQGSPESDDGPSVDSKVKSVWEMPGIPILPWVGSWPFLMFNKDWNYHNLPKFHNACFAKYGRIFRLCHPGAGNQVFISDIDDIQHLFHAPSVVHIHQRAHNEALIQIRREELRRLFTKGDMSFSSGLEWHSVREIFNQWMLKDDHHLEAGLTDEVTLEFCNRIRRIRHPDTLQVPCNFIEEIMSWNMEALSYTLLGLRQRDVADDICQDSAAWDVIINRMFMTAAQEKTEYRPQLWKFRKTPSYKTLERLNCELLRYNHDQIDRRLEELEEDPLRGRNTVLESAMAHPHLTKGDVYFSLHNMLGAGMEVTPQHASKVLYCLAKYPAVQQKLRQEVDSVLGSGVPVAEAVISDMPYLRAVVKETLRFMPTTFCTNRILSEPVVLSNYSVPKGWSVAVPTMFIGLDERNVERSQEFIPERFIGRYNTLSPLPFSYLPFSYGRRQCVGKKIAEIMLRNLAARIVQNFEIEYKHLDLSQESHITMQLMGPLNFTFRDRKQNGKNIAK